ncbi:MAG TPA: ABC transporter permease [Acidobacteriota bacterium]|nr:ABC transporter permease [Acidobacteriota bacterium]
MKRAGLILPGLVLGLLLAFSWAAPFLAPYPPERQFRDFARMQPTVPLLRGPQGWTLRPHIHDYRPPSRPGQPYPRLSRLIPVRFWVDSEPYRWMGMTWRTRFFGLDDPQRQIFLLGTDQLGRDVFSRLLHGGWVSLTIGLAGVLAAALVGIAAGSLAGYVKGAADVIVMRLADVIFALPALFLIIGLRALYPAQLSAGAGWWMLVTAFALVGWATLARVIRGQVLSLNSREFVLYARACGASHWWILTRHILPFTLNTLLVQVTVMLPAFIILEATLSFLGVGVQPPQPSWGNLLADASNLAVMSSQPQRLMPGVLLLVTVLCLTLIADRIKGISKQRRLI